MFKAEVMEIAAEKVEPRFTGVTLRRGPTKPYIVWLNGAIVHFCKSEREAQQFLAERQAEGKASAW